MWNFFEKIMFLLNHLKIFLFPFIRQIYRKKYYFYKKIFTLTKLLRDCMMFSKVLICFSSFDN